jgi:hypothetical protein
MQKVFFILKTVSFCAGQADGGADEREEAGIEAAMAGIHLNPPLPAYGRIIFEGVKIFDWEENEK